MTIARKTIFGLTALIAAAGSAIVQKPIEGYPKTDIGYPLRLASSPDGSQLVMVFMTNFNGTAGYAVIRDYPNIFGGGYPSNPFSVIPGDNDSLISAPDNRTLAVVTTEGAAILLDSASSKDRHTFKPAKGKWFAAAFSPDSKTLATGGTSGDATATDSGVLKLWDAIRLKEKTTMALKGPPVTALAFSPDGKTLAVGCDNGTIALWTVDNAKPLTTLEKHDGAVTSLAFAPDGTTLLSGGVDKSVRMWDVSIGKEKLYFAGHARPVQHVGFAPNGKTPYSLSSDATLRLWDVKTEKEQAIMKSTFGGAFVLDRDKKKILVTSPDSLTLAKSSLIPWDVSEWLEKAPAPAPAPKPEEKKD